MSRRFAIIPARALDDERLIANDILILCALGRHTDKAGWCAVRQSVIADAVRLSRAYVNKRIKHIAACGYVEKHSQSRAGRGRVASHYRVLFDVSVPPEADVPDEHIGGADVPPANTPPVFTANTAIDEEREQDNERYGIGAGARSQSSEIFDLIKHGLTQAAGDGVDWNSPGIALLSEPLRWVTGENPCDLYLDVCPAVKAVVTGRHGEPPVRAWAYFTRPVFDARDKRLSPNPNPQRPKAKNDRPSPSQTRAAEKSAKLDRAFGAAMERVVADRASRH